MSRQVTVSFISTHPPAGSDKAQACLDAALTFAVYDQRVHYLFFGDGVWQLLKSKPQVSGSKPIASALGAMELYGISKVYACATSAAQRALNPEDFIEGVELLDSSKMQALLEASDSVFVF